MSAIKYDIDWKIVNNNLRCPKCGDKGNLTAESDGTEAQHSHYWKVSREDAARITQEYRTSEQRLTALLKTASPKQIENAIKALEDGDE